MNYTLYIEWQRYLVEKDRSNQNKAEAIAWLLSAMNTIRFSRAQVEEFFPTAFLPKKLNFDAKGIEDDYWPYLNILLSTTRTVSSSKVEEVPVKSSRIFREACYFLRKEEWVYTLDISYEDVLRRHLWLKVKDDWERTPLLVPVFLKGIDSSTYITLEKSQVTNICISQKNL